MHTRSRRRPAPPPRRTRPCLEALEDRDLPTASTFLSDPPATSVAHTSSAAEADEYTTTPTADTSAHPQTAVNVVYDQYDWVRAPRPATLSPSATAPADVGAVADAVRAQRKEIGVPEPPPAAPAHGPSEGASGNDVLVLSAPPASPAAPAGVGLADVEGGPTTEAQEVIPAGAVPLENLAAGASRTETEAAAHVADLAPHLGPVLAGNLQSGPGELNSLAGRVQSFFSQLRALEVPSADAESSLGLTPWVVAVAASAAALEFGRRRWRRPAPEGLSTRPPTWVRRCGHLVPAEELQ